MATRISRRAYAEMFGPTTGDRLRLADTNLVIEVEHDHTVYGEEVKFGGGKVIRDGMGQGQGMAAEVADTVITNALIVDAVLGIVKADVGLKSGRIWRIGKAGNPDIQPSVTIPIGAATEIIAGEGMILTAGGVDTHIHFICPQQVDEALASGITTMIGGGTGPAAGTNATTVTPGPWHLERMLQAADALPMNIGFIGNEFDKMKKFDETHNKDGSLKKTQLIILLIMIKFKCSFRKAHTFYKFYEPFF